MGHGIDAARSISPIHAKLLDNLKDQLLIVFLKRLGGDITIPLTEIDDTCMDLFMLSVDEKHNFHFKIKKKN